MPRMNSDSRSHWHAWVPAWRTVRPKPPPVFLWEQPHDQQLNVQQLNDRISQNLDAQNPLLQRLRAIDAELAELDPCPDTSFLDPSSFNSKEGYEYALKAKVKAVCAFLPPVNLHKSPDYNFLWQLQCLAQQLAPLYVQICNTSWRDRDEFRHLFGQILTLWDDVPYIQADGTRVPAALRHSTAIKYFLEVVHGSKRKPLSARQKRLLQANWKAHLNLKLHQRLKDIALAKSNEEGQKRRYYKKLRQASVASHLVKKTAYGEKHCECLLNADCHSTSCNSPCFCYRPF